MTIATTIAESVRAALEQVAPTCNAGLVSKAIANNAGQALASDPVELLRAALTMLGAVDARIARMPAGHHAIDIQMSTADEAAYLASLLSMPVPQRATNGRNEWWVSERGEYGEERISIVGGHRPLCQCHGKDVGR